MPSLYVRCCLAVALLAPLGHAAAAPVPRETSPAPVSAGAGTTVAAGETMHGHGAHGEAARVGDLVVENPWARESVTPTGVVYLTVRNGGGEDDRLVGISTDVADRAELHSSVMQDGVMRMRPVEAIEVPAHGEAVLEPGGVHVMLIGLKGPLQEGGSFALTLAFEKAGEVEVMTTIEDIAHGGAGQGHGHGN
jgi:periplasmic copper chaperone A